MTAPSRKQKQKQLESFLDSISTYWSEQARTRHIHSNTCVVCAGPATHFKDALSEREYTISGMCQTCQDSKFTE